MSERPTGTVTFLFTDIDGSTDRWEHHPDAMADALTRHDALVRSAIEAAGLVAREFDAYQEHIRGRLSGIPEIWGRPVYDAHGHWGGATPTLPEPGAIGALLDLTGRSQPWSRPPATGGSILAARSRRSAGLTR